MDIDKLQATRRHATKLAWDRGCNIALVDAIRYSRNWADLKQVAEQATGVGSESVRTFLNAVIPDPED